MRKAGIIGGMGPRPRSIITAGSRDGYRAAKNDGSYPSLTLESMNMAEMLAFVKLEAGVHLFMLLAAVRNFKNAGAEFAAIAANTPTSCSVSWRKSLPCPREHLEATCRFAADAGCARVIILGTKFTMTSGLYTEIFPRYGIEALIPDWEGREFVHSMIFPRLADGIVDPEDKEDMIEFAEELIRNSHADAVVLGCTELR